MITYKSVCVRRKRPVQSFPDVLNQCFSNLQLVDLSTPRIPQPHMLAGEFWELTPKWLKVSKFGKDHSKWSSGRSTTGIRTGMWWGEKYNDMWFWDCFLGFVEEKQLRCGSAMNETWDAKQGIHWLRWAAQSISTGNEVQRGAKVLFSLFLNDWNENNISRGVISMHLYSYMKLLQPVPHEMLTLFFQLLSLKMKMEFQCGIKRQTDRVEGRGGERRCLRKKSAAREEEIHLNNNKNFTLEDKSIYIKETECRT